MKIDDLTATSLYSVKGGEIYLLVRNLILYNEIRDEDGNAIQKEMS